VGRLLGWLSIPWALAVFFGLDAVLRPIGYPLGQQPPLLRLLVIVVALAPGALAIASPWLGRLPTMGWLLAKPQPEVRLNAGGIRLVLPDRPVQTSAWSDIAGLVPSNDLRRTSSLLGIDGQVLATIPPGLVMQRARGPGPHSLAEAVVVIRPDRYMAAPPWMDGVPTSFAIRAAGASDPALNPRRLYVPALTVVVLLLGIGAVAAFVWVNAGP
jgi:hypothetical protein